MKNVFIIGSKGIPAKYGGFETFVDKLVLNKKNEDIKYNVACLSDKNEEFKYNGARCFEVNVPNIGAAKAVYYDINALKQSIKYIKENKIEKPTICILACRIGPFIKRYKKQIQKLGGTLIVNPDGHEWKRAKWNWFIKQYWKVSERLMVKNADLLVCDSKAIEKYILLEYEKYKPNTTFIAYGADVSTDKVEDDDELLSWYKKYKIKKKEYYLIVGRFVPENNYEIMISEFMKTKTKKDLVIITNVENNKFYKSLLEKTNFDKDKRIKFVGTVYNQELLKEVRKNAYGYLHGHEVGGTNPSLLEALASTDLNILLDVEFNKEVGGNGALYFNKENKSLSELIDSELDAKQIDELGKKAKSRIVDDYSWKKIIDRYEGIFIGN